MSETPENSEKIEIDREKFKKAMAERESHKSLVDKDFIPQFFPTFRITHKLYPIPIIITVISAGILAYITYVLAGIQIEGGYVSEAEYGPAAALWNGIIFTALAGFSSFIIIFLVKKKGIDVLKYIFGASFGFIGFFLTIFFGEIILYLIFYNFFYDYGLQYMISIYILYIGSAIFTVLMIYRYLTTKSFIVKNCIVLYIGLLIGAMMGTVMPLWTTVAILIGISCWDIFAVKHKRGPIKEMIDIASEGTTEESLSEEEVNAKIESGEIEYDTSKLEIGIGDLAFYSMLTSCALIQTSNVVVMILTALAIIIGTGITISGLRRNKILPGLPISIFLGLGTMLLSWYLISLI